VMKLTAVGKRVPRIDGPEKVTGQTTFGADLALPGMVWGAVLRSPHAHAHVRGVGTGEAEKMPGVLAVLTGQDFPRTDFSGVPVLALTKVRYQGEPVAAAAAETYEQAVAALSKVEVDYEPLPVVNDVREAIGPDTPRVHEVSEDPDLPNVCGVAAVNRGDVDAGFAEADHIFEDTFETPWVHQGFLEPHCALASASPTDDRITIWTSTQDQFGQRAGIAYILGLHMNRVRVIGLPVGGAFGGKIALCVEPVCAELSRRTGRPVKLVVSRREDFVATRPCGAAVLELKTGVRKDGGLVALQARLLFDTGAYAGAQNDNGASLVQGPYRIPNLAVKSYAIYTNKPAAGARRALASPHVHFAIESQMDIIAHALRLDPVEMRRRNALREGDPVLGDMEMPYTIAARVIECAAERAGWSTRPSPSRRSGRKVRGRGIAAGHWSIWASRSAAWVQLTDDGSISVVTGAIDLTGTTTSFAQIAAESFGVPVERVSVHQGDTETGPRNDGSWNSRILFSVGEAVRRACEDAKGQLTKQIADHWEVAPDEVHVAEGRVGGPRGHTLTLGEAAARAGEDLGAIIGRASLSDLPLSIAVAAQVAEVEVDTETGQWQLTGLTCAQDVGLAINPMSVEGQIEGAASQGLGYAMCEEYVYDEHGRLLNPDLQDFRIPTSVDHPEFAIRLIQEQQDGGPFGAKGVGEPPLVPTAPAIANAIFDAVGVRVRALPITPERLYRELHRED